MHTRRALSALAVAGALSTALALGADAPLLLTNDDGWKHPNILALYQSLKKLLVDGSKVKPVISAPETDQSGKGGLDPNAKTDVANGVDRDDPAIHWVRSYPVTSARYGLDILGRKTWGSDSPVLVLSGINDYRNTGEQLPSSGTCQNAVFASRRGIPAVALSGVARVPTAKRPDPPEAKSWDEARPVYAELSTKLVGQILGSKDFSEWPKGVWLNVNFPDVGGKCTKAGDFKWVLSQIDMNNLSELRRSAIIRKGAEGRDLEKCNLEDLPIEQEVLKNAPAGSCLVSVSINDSLEGRVEKHLNRDWTSDMDGPGFLPGSPFEKEEKVDWSDMELVGPPVTSEPPHRKEYDEEKYRKEYEEKYRTIAHASLERTKIVKKILDDILSCK
ncbi:Uu.00g040980.m01.CDS01 [Anthostomella pinea]|uniref:Uu.00g040980.m01.CDS01 n=1 Tax=Anthostomella pinea TaxID=933095 RepID=A0AAI8VAB1_9PEZI|nr:Uu.00g040980.m01.CDS01 [Anthostomella pinea]